MKIVYTTALLLAIMTACNKDDTNETTKTKHTIYYEAIIESSGDVEFTHIGYKNFSDSANVTYIDSLKTAHFISDTMIYTDDGINKFVDTYFAATATAKSAAKLTLRTVVDGNVREMTDTGTEMEASDGPRWVFD